MLEKDRSYMRDVRVMDKHPHLQPKMRAILLDWLMEASTRTLDVLTLNVFISLALSHTHSLRHGIVHHIDYVLQKTDCIDVLYRLIEALPTVDELTAVLL